MNSFALAYREQQQLFLFDKTYFATTLLKVGGFSTIIARFIVQFFWNPVVALILTFSLLAVTSYLLWVFIRTSRSDWQTSPLCLVPSLFIGASLSDNSLHFDYLTAVMLVLAGLVIFKNIRTRRVFAGITMTVLLYAMTGPASCLFAFGALIVELSGNKKINLSAFSFPVVFFLCGIASCLISETATFAASFAPSFHYDLDARMPAVHWLGWLSAMAVFIVCRVKGKRTLFLSGLSMLVIAIVAGVCISRDLDSKANLTGYEYEHYTVNERWSDLAASCRRHVWSPGTANYFNLASAYAGTLADDILKSDNRGVSSLLLIPEAKTVDVRVAHIMFAMGNMAAAQNVAFNALFTSEGYSPAMLKMNAQIELMRGSYSVADKYLSLLEKSLRYRKWATEQRRFLWNDQEVGADILLGNGRKDFPSSDGFAMFENPIDELMMVIDANPSDGRAMQYGLSFLLLSKDIARLQKFVDLYWQTPALQTLPVPVQEALVFYSGYSRNFDNVEAVSIEWCLDHGVTPEVITRFSEFQNASLRSGRTAPKGFRGTYWDYLINKEI